MTLPMIIYTTAVKDLQNALQNDTLTFMEWFEKFKAISEEFHKDYPKEVLADILNKINGGL